MRSFRILRAVAGLKGRDLARRVGITASHLCDVEAGRERASDALTLRLLAELEAELGGRHNQD